MFKLILATSTCEHLASKSVLRSSYATEVSDSSSLAGEPSMPILRQEPLVAVGLDLVPQQVILLFLNK